MIIDTEDIILIIPPGSFTQWIADNVDHNSQTIDGKHTFHGIEIVTSVTLCISSLSTAMKISHDSCAWRSDAHISLTSVLFEQILVHDFDEFQRIVSSG